MNKDFKVWDVVEGKWSKETYFIDNDGDLCQRTINGVSPELPESIARAYHYTGNKYKDRKIYEGDAYYVAGNGIGIVEICPIYGTVFHMKFSLEDNIDMPLVDVLAENDLGGYLGHIEELTDKLEVT